MTKTIQNNKKQKKSVTALIAPRINKEKKQISLYNKCIFD